MSAFAMVTRNTLLEHQLFTRIFAPTSSFMFPMLLLTIDIGLFVIPYTYKLAKFEQNGMIRTTQIWIFLTKNLFTFFYYFWNIASAILKKVLHAKQ